jgi:hypothetical protein
LGSVRKPIASPVGRPWQLSWLDALSAKEGSGFAPTLEAYRRLVPPRACVGAVLGPDDPSLLLFGAELEHHVVYLSNTNAPVEALRNHLFYVAVTTGVNRWVAAEFTRNGWTQRKADAPARLARLGAAGLPFHGLRRQRRRGAAAAARAGGDRRRSSSRACSLRRHSQPLAPRRRRSTRSTDALVHRPLPYRDFYESIAGSVPVFVSRRSCGTSTTSSC